MFFKTKRKETGPNKVTEGTIKKGSEIFDIIRNTYPKSKRKSVKIKFLLFSDQGGLGLNDCTT